MLTLVNTEAGNFNSVVNAIRHIGGEVSITNNAEDIRRASAIILPGVAAFESGMLSLKKNKLIDVIRKKVVEDKTPIIGICLGMQLLAESSTEHGKHEGLGLLNSKVVKLTPKSKEYRVPNIGWSTVIRKKDGVLFSGDSENHSFYHVHSYHMQCEDEGDVAAVIEYDGRQVTVAVERDNIFGVQFHPEKSQDAGLDLLERFLKHTNNIRG